MTEASTDFAIQAANAHDSRRRVAVIISLILILAAAGASLFVVRGVDEQLADVATTYEVRRHARELILAITDAETGQRGYLLTQDARYLVPYEQATGSLDESYEALVGLLAPTPGEAGDHHRAAW